MKNILKISRWKIKYKLTAAMYAILIPILTGITGYIYNQSSKKVTGELSSAYQNITNTLEEAVNYIATDVNDIITYIVINKDFRFVMNETPESELYSDPLVWSRQTPADFVTEVLAVKNHITCLGLYPENGIQPFLAVRNRESITRDKEQVKQLEVFQMSRDSFGNLSMMEMKAGDNRLFINNNRDRIIFGKSVLSYNKEKVLGYICAAIDANVIRDIFNNNRLEANETVYLLDQNANIMVCSGEVKDADIKYIKDYILKENKQDIFWQANGSYIISSHNKDYNYYVFYVVPKGNWTEQLVNVVKMPIIIIVILIFLTFPIFNYITRFINIPLNNLHKSMIKLQEGDFKQHVKVYAEDEIGEVTKVYNEMVKRLNELIEKNYILALHEKQSELDILQAQINPHFLYNTLDSLYWDAYNSGQLELSENIMALSDLFRLALSCGEGIVTVETEIMLIERYLKIQKARYENKLDYKINLMSEMKSCKIPKLIIQPFVENAIVHGLEKKKEQGIIKVHGFLEDNYMVFKVSDNGIGMNQEQIDSLFMESEDQYKHQRISRYAIKNIRSRLKLHYGEDFSMVISSAVGVGTTITLKIPIKEFS